MTARRILYLCSILVFAGMASPAAAECNDEPYYCWLHAHRAIAHMQNRIAYLEADPNADDGLQGSDHRQVAPQGLAATHGDRTALAALADAMLL